MTETTHAVARPVMRTRDEGDRRWFFGGGIQSWIISAEDSGGAFLMTDTTDLEQGKTTPLHTHPADETLYVIDGSIRMHLDGTERDLDAGGVALAPAGVPHAFLVLSSTARVLAVHTPGSCEAFYLAASEPYEEGRKHVVDFDRIREAGRTAGGIDIVGPPPF